MIPGDLNNNFEDKSLVEEARLFTRYLLDTEPPEEMIDRYIEANRKLGTDSATSVDAKIMEFALSHPWSVPFLDAAAGFLQPDALIRKKIYIMAAVLEAAPRYARDFLPENLSSLLLIFRLLKNGLTAGLKILVGVPMFYALRKINEPSAHAGNLKILI